MTSADESCRRILVADDDDETRWLVATVLAASGFAVEAAADGEEALERIRRRQPDLVLLDVRMPRLDGWGVLRRLRELPQPPAVIVLSAEPDCRRALSEGADGCLPKPFRIERLVAACRKSLAASRARAAPSRCADMLPALAHAAPRA